LEVPDGTRRPLYRILYRDRKKRRRPVSEQHREEVLDGLREIFAGRVRRSSPQDGSVTDGELASVQPYDAEEIVRLAKLAESHSVPLIPSGAGTGFAAQPSEGGILIRFDLMRGVRSPDPDDPWIEAEPGATWLELEDALRPGGRGLTVYPTSAPRATVGGWLAQDGIGVGSFEYGWLRENIVSASVVVVGGKRREVGGEELRSFLAPDGDRGLIVGARLETRRADADVPFAASFADAESLTGAVAGVLEARLPLWHVALLNPAMARARVSADAHLLFGAYPREREVRIAGPLREIVESGVGRILDAADAYRLWSERFFPMGPSRPSPEPTDRVLAPVGDLPGVLDRLSRGAVQGTVARSGEVLLIALDEASREGRSR
jgi:FAD/FMN-containing dehydrogenase